MKLFLVAEERAGHTVLSDAIRNALVDVIAVFSESASIIRLCEQNEVECARPDLLEAWDIPRDSWLVNVAGLHVFSSSLLQRFEGRCLNLHPGKLPEYAGLYVHQWAIRNGEAEAYATIHFMTGELDAGDVVDEQAFPIEDDETGLRLYRRLMSAGAELMVGVLAKIAQGIELPRFPQNLSNRTLYRGRDVGDGRINPHWSARQVCDFVRAADYRPFRSPSYQPWLEDETGQRRFVRSARIETFTELPAGSFAKGIDGRDAIACGDGLLVSMVFKDG